MNIVIIGGTSGIGLAAAEHFLEKGNNVTVGGRRLLSDSSNLNSLQIDVTDEDSVQKFFEKIEVIDSLIFSTGVTSQPLEIHGFKTENFDQVFNTNVRGALLTLKYAYPLLKKSKGNIVIINSVAARNFSLLSSVEYTMSKYALRGLVTQLSQSFAKDSVRINSLFPSMTRTPMLEKNVEKSRLEEIEKKIPLGRIAETSEIVSGIEYLISDNSSYVTGTGLDINGGLLPNG